MNYYNDTLTTKEKRQMKPNVIIPVRLTPEQAKLLDNFKDKTDLAKSFVIRRCITYALDKFTSGEIDVLTLKRQKQFSPLI